MPRLLIVLNREPDVAVADLMQPSWWESYFLDPHDGHCGYWLKQSDNEVNLTGSVIGWLDVGLTDAQRDSRDQSSQALAEWVKANEDVDFKDVDILVCVHGLKPATKSDGGHTIIKVGEKWLHAVVARAGDPFDFFAHEIGHGLGLHHSFGHPEYQAEGERAGGYGHPHCIMSAMVYGGIPGGGPYVVPAGATPKDGRNEYDRLGPGLNAATAFSRNWINASHFIVAGGKTREIEIRSRNFGGRKSSPIPQAIRVIRPNGHDFFIEYREAVDWDRGQTGDRVIVTQDRGGLGALYYKDAHVGTFLWAQTVPETNGVISEVVAFPQFTMQVLAKNRVKRTVRIRLIPGFIGAIEDSCTVRTIKRTPLRSGMTTFAPGELRCVSGRWRYSEQLLVQEAVVEIRSPAALPWLDVRWTVEDQPLVELQGTLTWNSKRVYIDNAKKQPWPSSSTVTVQYRIETTSKSARLRLTSAPPNWRFQLAVDAEVVNLAGSLPRKYSVEMTSYVFEYGARFEAKRLQCLANLANPGGRFPTYEVVVHDPDFWGRIPKENRPDVVRHLKVLANLRSKGSTRELQRALREFEGLTFGKAADLEIRRVRRLPALSAKTLEDAKRRSSSTNKRAAASSPA